MNRKEIIEDITSDVAFMSKWRSMVSSGDLEKILRLANCYRGEYAKTQKPPEQPHIRSEQNGGMRAWDKLEYLIMSLPFKENREYNEESTEYVGYVKDHVAASVQESYED
jgi:hypothetical protein